MIAILLLLLSACKLGPLSKKQTTSIVQEKVIVPVKEPESDIPVVTAKPVISSTSNPIIAPIQPPVVNIEPDPLPVQIIPITTDSRLPAPMTPILSTIYDPTTKAYKLTGSQKIQAIDNGQAIVSNEYHPLMGGKMVIITHEINNIQYMSIYGGLDNIIVADKAMVTRGQDIGTLVGKTLHFEMRENTQPIDAKVLVQLD